MPGPSTATLLWRGLTMRCPVCGQGGLFRRWLTMVDDCPRCGLHFERVEGHWIGAVGINTIVTFGVLVVLLVAGFVLTHPETPTLALALGLAVVGTVMPIAFYPASKTLWTAVDLRMRPLDPDEVFPGFWQ